MVNTGHKKTSWIADHIHGPIPLSTLEMALISTATYNRLHNILQNSTLHFTFPSNRTSRFIHSLGCAHLAGMMFHSALLNAAKDCQDRFLDETREVLAEIDVKGQAEAGRIKESAATLKKEDPVEFIDPIYHTIMPPGFAKDQRYLYILLYQSIRFAALLHDIGHPPFSHVVENALIQIRDWLSEKGNRTKSQNQLLTSLQNPGAVFHEGLGHLLAEHVLEDLSDQVQDDKCKLRFDLIRIRHLTIAILKKETAFFESLGTIVSGDFDADRLDYVSRDSVLCSLRKAPIDTTRLMKSFLLLGEPAQGSNPVAPFKGFVVVPSTRALGTFEEFFWRRFDLYKYAIYHHRVVKFDSLLQICVVELAKKYLSKDKTRTSAKNQTAQARLKDDISGLWEILAQDRIGFARDRTDAFIQWDDSWLISVLRRNYFEHPARKNSERADNLFYKLEELVSNKKWYYTLFKRADSFSDVESAFLRELPKAFDWTWIANGDAQHLKEEQNLAAKRAGSALAPDGLFLSSVFGSLRTRLKLHIGELVLNATCRDLEKSDVAEAFFSVKWVKPGLKDEFLIADSNGQPLRVGRVTRIVHELREAARFFPPFFIFIRPKAADDVNEGALKGVRTRFGHLLAQNLQKYCKPLYSEEQKGGAKKHV